MIKKLFLNDRFILLLIILIAAVIFVGGFDIGDRNNYILSVIDNSITMLFIVELIVKLKFYGIKYFASSWNKFDFILIILSIPALFAFLFKLDDVDFSFLLVFRAMRVLKSYRFLKFIPGLELLIKGIHRALKASLIAIFGFVVYVFIIGIFSFNLFKEISPKYFHNPFTALYTTFKLCTLEGWSEIPEQITSNLSPTISFLTYLYFVLIVLSGGILGLSLVNSIFVDAMVSENNADIEKKIDRIESKLDLLIQKGENAS